MRSHFACIPNVHDARASPTIARGARRPWRTTSERDTPVNTPVMSVSPPNAAPNVAATPPSAFAAAAPGARFRSNPIPRSPRATRDGGF